jgi:tetratricopeptide (TPR) repeat protein
MPIRLAAPGLVVLVLLLLGAALVDADPSERAPQPSIPALRASEPASTPPAVAPRDANVALWQDRLDAGGGVETTLHLVDALIERARATGTLDDLGHASDALDAIEPDAPPNEAGVPLRRGRIAFALHEFAAARDAAAVALAIDPIDPAALALAADAALEMGDLEAADAAYARLAEAGRRPPILSRLARRAWLGGDAEAAEALVHEAIRAASYLGGGDEVAFYHYQLGEMLRARNAFADAEAEYLAALDAQPDHVPSSGGLALVRAALGDRDEAIRLLEAATARLPAPDLVAALGDLYALAGRDDEAADQWALVERIGDVGQANGGVYDRQLVLFLADHDRDPERAVALASAELELRADVYAHDALAWALFKAGRLAEADAAATEALRLGTPDGRLHYHAGLIAEALGRTEDARALFAFAADHSGGLPPLQVGLLADAVERLAP